ncbi:hypothetical protein AHAS_Ahas15G0131900 [Arachis hypogaea]
MPTLLRWKAFRLSCIILEVLPHSLPFRHPTIFAPASLSTFFSLSITDLNPSSIGVGLTFLISHYDHSLGDPSPFLALNDNHVGINLKSIDLNGVVLVQAADLGLLLQCSRRHRVVTEVEAALSASSSITIVELLVVRGSALLPLSICSYPQPQLR